MIKFNKLNKYYNQGKKNELHVLKNVSYEFPSTGLITFLGESGCGKTTLLNLLGGLLYSDDTIYYDDVKFNNKNINELDNYRNKNIGFIFQNYLLLNDETVYDNLKLALEVCNIFDKEEQEKRIVETLKALKIYRYRKKLAGKLSGGEQQRVSIARAIVKGAKVLLCDEPTGNLDKKNSIKVMEILKSISKDTLVILVTHNKELARFYSDKIITMKDGEIISENKCENYTLDTSFSDTIYLGELENKQIDNEKLKINFYTDNSKNVNLRVILKNGHLFIESDVETMIFNEDSLDVRKGIKEDVSNENLEYDFKFSDFNDKYDNDYSYRNLLLKAFKNKKTNKKSKAFNIISFVLGFILAIFSLTTLNTFTNSTKNSFYDDKFYRLESEEHYVRDIVLDMVDKQIIDDVVVGNMYTNVNFSLPSFADKNYFLNPMHNFIRYEEQPLLLGVKPDENGIVIGEHIAYSICEEYDLSYEEIVGCKITYCDPRFKSTTFNINGITKNGNYIYIDKSFTKNVQYDRKKWNTINIEDKEKYKIIEESDKISGNGVYVEKSSGYKIGQYITYNILVKGFIEEIDDINPIVADKYVFTKLNPLDKYDYFNERIKIIEGRNILKHNEILLPKDYGYIGDTIGGLKVVGLYDTNLEDMEYSIIASDIIVDAFINGRSYLDMPLYYHSMFKTKDISKVKEYLKGTNIKGLTVMSDKDYMGQFRFNTDQISIMIIYFVLLVATLIYIYFIKRSELIVDHYNITVLRSMGATKKYIYKRYLVSNIVSSIKTITFGLVTGFIIYYFIFQKMYNVLFETLNIIILVPLILFSYFLISLIPLRGILKKEPAYLTAKYDI